MTFPVRPVRSTSGNAESTYIQEPPFFDAFGLQAGTIQDITGARPLAVLGDSVTTDHISPAGAIKPDAPAGRYLQEHGVTVKDFNSYGSRRGNDRIMTRGTFANVRIKNLMVPGIEGGVTQYHAGSWEEWRADGDLRCGHAISGRRHPTGRVGRGRSTAREVRVTGPPKGRGCLG